MFVGYALNFAAFSAAGSMAAYRCYQWLEVDGDFARNVGFVLAAAAGIAFGFAGRQVRYSLGLWARLAEWRGFGDRWKF